MSEEEKETIEDCKELVQELKQHKDKDFIGRLYYKNKPVEDALSVLLNLIEKQQKEIKHWKAGMKIVEKDKSNHIERLETELNSLKEIEKSHQEENGKLRVELEQEKEKNKGLEEVLDERFIYISGGRTFYERFNGLPKTEIIKHTLKLRNELESLIKEKKKTLL